VNEPRKKKMKMVDVIRVVIVVGSSFTGRQPGSWVQIAPSSPDGAVPNGQNMVVAMRQTTCTSATTYGYLRDPIRDQHSWSMYPPCTKCGPHASNSPISVLYSSSKGGLQVFLNVQSAVFCFWSAGVPMLVCSLWS
jgi:hypothetical protein